MASKGWVGVLVIGLALAILATPPSVVQSSDNGLFQGTGTVIYVNGVDPIDRFYYISADNGSHYQPENLPSMFEVNGLRIRFTATIWTSELTIKGMKAIILNTTQLLGDLNSDMKVDFLDAYWLGQAFGSRPSSIKWNPSADLNYDNVVDISDAISLAGDYGARVQQFSLEVNLGLNKTEYDLGEPINITLTATNITNETADFLLAPSWWDFLVYNDTNNCLYQWSHSGIMFPMWIMNVPLQPGMNITSEVMIWPQTCNATVDHYGTPVSPVSPGTYYIVGLYARVFPYDLQTAPVQINII